MCLRPVAESTASLEQGCATLRGGFVRLRAQAQKCAQGGGPLLRRHVLIGHLLLNAILIAGLHLLADRNFRQNYESREQRCTENRMAHARTPLSMTPHRR